MIRFPQTLLDSLWFFQWFTTLSLWCNTQLPIVQLATCLGVASPKLHLVTRAATLVYESYCMLSSKDVSGYALKSWKLLHSHTHVWKEMTYANNWCCCCSGNILQKFSVMNSRMFHDSLQFAVTTSHSHSRQKKKLSSSSSSFLWGLFNDSKGRSPPDSGIWSTKRLRSCWPGDQKNDSDSKNEILILKGELTYYPPLGRRWNHLSSLLLWGDIYIYNILYINIFLYIYISSLEDNNTSIVGHW